MRQPGLSGEGGGKELKAKQTTGTSRRWSSILSERRQAVKLFHDLNNVPKESNNEA